MPTKNYQFRIEFDHTWNFFCAVMRIINLTCVIGKITVLTSVLSHFLPEKRLTSLKKCRLPLAFGRTERPLAVLFLFTSLFLHFPVPYFPFPPFSLIFFPLSFQSMAIFSPPKSWSGSYKSSKIHVNYVHRNIFVKYSYLSSQNNFFTCIPPPTYFES